MHGDAVSVAQSVTDEECARVARCLERIGQDNRLINAIITEVCAESVIEATRESARSGASSVLRGMTIGIKDNIDTAGILTTAGSCLFRMNVPAADAPVVQRLRAAGAIIVGKTNLPEFCLGGTTQNPHFGDCENPWDIGRIPGGSSGGSAAAVAAQMCTGAIGTDTGGSIRIPSALCGVTGLRPTLGRVSTRGTFPVSHAFDTVGPIAYSALDVARIYAVIAGFDDQDPASVEASVESSSFGWQDGIAGVRIGIAHDAFLANVQPSVAAAVAVATQVLGELGCIASPIALTGIEEALIDARRLIWADAARIHSERLAHHADAIGAPVLARLRAGAATRYEDYADAVRRRQIWRRKVWQMFREVDLIVMPTVPREAPLRSAADTVTATEDLTRLTSPWAHAGVPAITVPCGFTGAGLPVGMQMIAGWWMESLLLKAAVAYQTRSEWHLRRPRPIQGQGNFPALRVFERHS